jgi:hypothetical protein
LDVLPHRPDGLSQKAGTTEKLSDAEILDIVEFLKIL